MKKILSAGVLIILLAILGFIAFWFSSYNKAQPVHTQNVQQAPVTAGTITATPVKENHDNADLNYKADIEYPQFTGMANTQVQDAINADLKNFALNTFDALKKDTNCKAITGQPLSDNPC